MIGRRVDSTKPITVAEVRELLEGEKEKRELSFEQQSALDYSQKVAKTTAKGADSMVQELVKIEKLTSEVAVKIVDMMAENKEQLAAIISKERYTLTEKEIGQILDILKKGAGSRPRPRPQEPPAEEAAPKQEEPS